MTFQSILWADGVSEENFDAPDSFGDLNLDRIVDAVTAGRQEYNLKPFFYSPLRNIDLIKYRQEVMRDLEDEDLRNIIKTFSEMMRTMRTYVSLSNNLN